MRKPREIDESIGRRARELRKKTGLTINETAKLMGLTAGFVTSIEIGKRGLTVKRAAQFAQIFKVSLDYLVLGREYKELKNRPNLEEAVAMLNYKEQERLAQFLRQFYAFRAVN